MKIIGISGKKQSGKDTFAKIMESYIKGKVEIIHFADPLYLEVAQAGGVTVSHLKEFKDVFRPILQWWGTEFRRKHQGNDNYWVDQLAKTIEGMRGTVDVVIVPDVRFPNEFEFLDNINATLIRIERPNLKSTDAHSSETALDGPDYTWHRVVINNGTILDLKQKALLWD